MKKISFFLLFLVISVAAAQEAVAISVDEKLSSECNLSKAFINQVKESINEQWNLSPYKFSNLTSSYCYDNSVSLTIIFKKNQSSMKGESISVSLYKRELFDYDLIFTNKERELLSYTLKEKYTEYLVNGTDEEYYVSLSPQYDEEAKCSALRSFYNTLSGEKYFNEERGYCSIVLKTRTSRVKELVHDSVSYINYFGKEVRYSFSGYSGGDYNLASLADSIDCELSTGNYYYPEFETNCYGIYKDKSRIHFSARNQISDSWVYLNVYGIIDGKARLTASAYGEGVKKESAEEWVNNELNTYFPGQTLSLEEDDETFTKSFSASKIVSSFSFNNEALNNFDLRKELMNTYYSKGNTSIVISEPYIQVYAPETMEPREIGIMPPVYWGRHFIITNNRVYSSISLEENSESIAVNKIKEFINPYLETGEWELNMTVTGNYYWPLLIMKGSTLRAMAETDASSIQAQTPQGVTDPLAQEHPGFEGLEEGSEPTVIELIINFFKELFS